MKKLIILQGPPCSGKSTWVKDFLKDPNEADKWMVINRDQIRYVIGNGEYTLKHENEVTELQNVKYKCAFEHGLNIISDNTNLNSKSINDLENWAAEHDYEVEYNHFYVPYHEAMRRSKERKANGGLYISKEVMRRFYLRYYPNEFRKEMTDAKIKDHEISLANTLKPAIIVDLDGTIALHNGREPFEWDLLETDVMDARMKTIIMSMQKDVKVIFLTGRPEKVRTQTIKWLEPIECDYDLYMRADNDFSHGDDYKRKVYLEKIKSNYNVIAAFEDSQKCIDMWRSEGILCCAVANNDY